MVLVSSCTEISVDLGEAVEHLRHVHDDVPYKCTITLLYFTQIILE